MADNSSSNMGMLTSLRPNPGRMVSKGNHPQMGEQFRLVKYYDLPKYIYINIIYYYISNSRVWVCPEMRDRIFLAAAKLRPDNPLISMIYDELPLIEHNDFP